MKVKEIGDKIEVSGVIEEIFGKDLGMVQKPRVLVNSRREKTYPKMIL